MLIKNSKKVSDEECVINVQMKTQSYSFPLLSVFNPSDVLNRLQLKSLVVLCGLWIFQGAAWNSLELEREERTELHCNKSAFMRILTINTV